MVEERERKGREKARAGWGVEEGQMAKEGSSKGRFEAKRECGNEGTKRGRGGASASPLRHARSLCTSRAPKSTKMAVTMTEKEFGFDVSTKIVI